MSRRVRDIVIDLTSLLDVVMILIFAVMMQNSKTTANAQAELEAADASMAEMGASMEELEEQIASGEEEIASLSKELADMLAMLEESGLTEDELNELLLEKQNAENRNEAYEYLDEIFVTVNVGLENRGSSRCLTYSKGIEDEINVLIDSDDDISWKEEVNKLAVFIQDREKEVINSDNENTVLYVIFSYDSSKVYRDDCRDIQKVLSNAELSRSGKVNCRAKELKKDD